jgi:hypothetical protein
MTRKTNFAFLPVLTFIFGSTTLRAHDHLAAGATANTNGATLVFQNAADFGGEAGFVFHLTPGTTNDAYLGYYYTDELVFSALAATPDDGGPEPGAAALGTYIQAKLLRVEGPAGATFGFWEAGQDGFDSTNLTWTVPVPYENGTNLIAVTESDGSPGADPYGHRHGRIFSFTKPGLYKVTWQFVDTSTNGLNGGPVDLPSLPFYLYYQADLTIGAIGRTGDGVSVTFAAASNLPDSGAGPPTNYTLLTSSSLDPEALWRPVGTTVMGDDHLHAIVVPNQGPSQFFRLLSNSNP